MVFLMVLFLLGFLLLLLLLLVLRLRLRLFDRAVRRFFFNSVLANDFVVVFFADLTLVVSRPLQQTVLECSFYQ